MSDKVTINLMRHSLDELADRCGHVLSNQSRSRRNALLYDNKPCKRAFLSERSVRITRQNKFCARGLSKKQDE